MKSTLINLLPVMLVFLLASQVHACDFKFESQTDQVKVGETIDVKVTVIYEHRRCLIQLDDTEFTFKHFELEKKSDWTEIRRGQYSIVLTLKATESGEGSLEVIRECSRNGRFSESKTFTILALNS